MGHDERRDPERESDDAPQAAASARDTWLGIALFAVVVLVNGLLAVLLLEVLEVSTWFEAAPVESSRGPLLSGGRPAHAGDGAEA